MKLTAPRENILAPLQSVIGVVERRQTMPILANVLLAAHDNRLSVTGTDLEVELVAAANIEVQQNGAITVPGRKLLDIFRALPEKTNVTLSTEGERLTVRAGRWHLDRSPRCGTWREGWTPPRAARVALGRQVGAAPQARP